ncbi:hypothetical protein CFC21_062704 [Triticum aestivum]|uniref:F-box domain-containing protein n=2 Tax=Triticum aestivum TaxID=4565 RepID=A0A3B6JKT9_WHEAT|nr:uncharacterized protein LOC123100211 [Triticum aestivum]KAF7055136.1 hypothetical protein CFC21_062704 [Triticum aestivum]
MDLPEEMLADILRRVPARHLAACRRVCGYWRATIDAGRLVLPHLLPGAPSGAFVNMPEASRGTYFFARGGPTGGVDTRLADAPTRWCTAFLDHCNGVLMCEASEGTRFVYNPATRRSAVLPPAPRAEPWGVASAAYLVFDPFVSLHHEVLLLPELPGEPQPPEPTDPPPLPPFNVARLFFADAESSPPPQIVTDEEDWLSSDSEDEPRKLARPRQREHIEAKDTLGLMEWPPSPYVVQVFSSETGRWDDRAFFREGAAAGTVADMWSDPLSSSYVMGFYLPDCGPRRRDAVYWRQSLYVHCRGGFIIRLSLLTGKYVVIKTPGVTKVAERPWAMPRLSKSRKGVYCTIIDMLKLQVWVLTEEESPTATPVWEMAHQADLEPSIRQLMCKSLQNTEKSWILDDPRRSKSSAEQRCREWDSDNDDDDGAYVEEEEGGGAFGWLDFLGYHPHKEIVLLGHQYKRCAYAYYLSTSKLEYLGDLCPVPDDYFPACVQESYVYTPCRIDLLSDENGVSVDLSKWVS